MLQFIHFVAEAFHLVPHLLKLLQDVVYRIIVVMVFVLVCFVEFTLQLLGLLSHMFSDIVQSRLVQMVNGLMHMFEPLGNMFMMFRFFAIVLQMLVQLSHSAARDIGFMLKFFPLSFRTFDVLQFALFFLQDSQPFSQFHNFRMVSLGMFFANSFGLCHQVPCPEHQSLCFVPPSEFSQLSGFPLQGF